MLRWEHLSPPSRYWKCVCLTRLVPRRGTTGSVYCSRNPNSHFSKLLAAQRLTGITHFSTSPVCPRGLPCVWPTVFAPADPFLAPPSHPLGLAHEQSQVPRHQNWWG
jgi:hypothetical protein